MVFTENSVKLVEKLPLVGDKGSLMSAASAAFFSMLLFMPPNSGASAKTAESSEEIFCIYDNTYPNMVLRPDIIERPQILGSKL